jgi:hypothetical protein
MGYEHYVIINDWATEYENGASILGVVHSLEEAKRIFNEYAAEEKQYAEEHGFEIYEDDEADFDAGEEGFYVSNHTRVYIQGV